MKILVLEAFGLHLGYLGCYGNEWVATPTLDRLASRGVTFDWHIADQPELLPTTPWAKRSVASGFYRPHPSSAAQPRVVRCAALATFANKVLRALESEDRWLWIEGPNLVPPWRLPADLRDVYFDEDDTDEGLMPWIDPPLDAVELEDADVLRIQNTYAAAVTFFDAQLGALLDQLPGDTLLCVTARSGLPLGEHGMIGTPRARLHDELVHTPMVWRLPGATEGGLRVAALTQSVDLLPSFLEFLEEPIPPMHGRSLWPLIRGEVDAIRPFAVATMQSEGEASQLLRTLDRAFHLTTAIDGNTSATQLFVKPEDRWEVNDVSQHQADVCETMQAQLRAFLTAIEMPQPIDLAGVG